MIIHSMDFFFTRKLWIKQVSISPSSEISEHCQYVKSQVIMVFGINCCLVTMNTVYSSRA